MHSDGNCKKCPEGSICETDGVATQQSLELLPGFWRVSNSALTLVECSLPGACVGGALFENGGDAYCQPGHVGPLCSICDTDFVFSASLQSCVECDVNIAKSWLTVPMMCVLCLLGVGLILSMYSTCMNHATKIRDASDLSDRANQKYLALLGAYEDDLEVTGVKYHSNGSISYVKSTETDVPEESNSSKLIHKLPIARISVATDVTLSGTRTTVVTTTLMPAPNLATFVRVVRRIQIKLKPLLSYFQIAINIGFNCNVRFPRLFELFLLNFDILNLNLPTLIGVPCVYANFDYISTLLTMTVMPLLLGTILLGIYYVITVGRQSFTLAHEIKT